MKSRLFAQVQADAKRLGQVILDRERGLSAGFAGRTMTDAALRAHLAVAPLLSAEQIAKYNQLRGYGAGDQPSPPHMHPGH